MSRGAAEDGGLGVYGVHLKAKHLLLFMLRRPQAGNTVFATCSFAELGLGFRPTLYRVRV